MIKITLEKAIYLHGILSKEAGTNPGLRDIGLLESAIEGAYQTFGGTELYPTVEEKGAWLGYALISNHAFVDGNKRIGALVMLTFLELNGIKLRLSDKELVDLILGVASGEIKYEGLLSVISEKID